MKNDPILISKLLGKLEEITKEQLTEAIKEVIKRRWGREKVKCVNQNIL